MKLLLIILLVFSGSVYGQNVSNRITDKHVRIPGTRVYVIPPKGFKLATNFIGLTDDKNSMIQIFDLNNGNFYSNARNFNQENFEMKGIKVFESKIFQMNQCPAKYLFLQGNEYMKAHEMIFGDSTFSVMLNGLYDTSNDEIGKEVKKCIFSAVYDKNIKIDELETAPFMLDGSNSKYKFAKQAGGMYIYSLNGVVKESYEDEPYLIITILPVSTEYTLKMVSEFSLGSLERLGFSPKETNLLYQGKINGYEAYEAVTSGDLKNEKRLMYHLVITHGDQIVFIQGSSHNDTENLTEFQEIARSIKFK